MAHRICAMHCWTGSHALSWSTVTQHSIQLGSGSRPCWGQVVFGSKSPICIGSGSKILCGEPLYCRSYTLMGFLSDVTGMGLWWAGGTMSPWCLSLGNFCKDGEGKREMEKNRRKIGKGKETNYFLKMEGKNHENSQRTFFFFTFWNYWLFLGLRNCTRMPCCKNTRTRH